MKKWKPWISTSAALEFQDAVDLYLELREASSHAEIDSIVKRLQSLLKKKADAGNPQSPA
jgi:hypothetical protein